jgi:single-strand DNA-binding protein
MADINRVVLTGRLTRDIELRTIPSGTSVAQFGLAVNRSRKNDAGEWVEEPNFFNIVVWGRQGENCANFLHKGSPVTLEGRLQSRSWETEDGQKRSVVEVVAENVRFTGSREGSGGGGQQSGSSQGDGGFKEINSGSEADVPF